MAFGPASGGVRYGTRGGREAQYLARAACDTLSAENAAAIVDRLLAPDVTTDVDAHRAVIGTDPTLHAARRVRGNVRVRQGMATTVFLPC
jgi:hypothetical protein